MIRQTEMATETHVVLPSAQVVENAFVEQYYHILRQSPEQSQAIIIEKHRINGCNVGEDGGFAPNISSSAEYLDLVKEAIDRAGYSERIKITMNVAATDFFIGTKYDLDHKSPNKSEQNFKTAEDMAEMYTQLCKVHPIVSIVDPFDKDDWEHTKLPNWSCVSYVLIYGNGGVVFIFNKIDL